MVRVAVLVVPATTAGKFMLPESAMTGPDGDGEDADPPQALASTKPNMNR